MVRYYWKQILEKSSNYILSRLRKRGLTQYSQLREGLEITSSEFCLAILQQESIPQNWKEFRPLVDRAIHRAIKELKAACTVQLSLLPPDLIEIGGPENFRDLEDGQSLLNYIEDLPPSDRLLVKVKLAYIFYPELPENSPSWRVDEKKYLEDQHPGTPFPQIIQGLQQQLLQNPRRYQEQTPTKIVAWFLGRSPGAIDQNLSTLRRRLRQVAAFFWFQNETIQKVPLLHRSIIHVIVFAEMKQFQLPLIGTTTYS